MNLLLENGAYQLLNFGDIAMLQVAVARLRGRWPAAQLSAVTFDPERLAFFCPGVAPVRPLGKRSWRSTATLPLELEVEAPSTWKSRAKEEVKGQLRELLRHGRRAATLHQGLPRSADPHDYLSALGRADTLVVTGGGYLADAWESHYLTLLDCVDLARRWGKRTLLLGHGYGPAESPRLNAAARRTLPRADFITIREGRFAPERLRRWRVPAHRFTVTGDDAIELAHARRPARLGTMLGLNLRSASYSGVGDPELPALRQGLLAAASELKAEFLPFPISCIPAHPDLHAVARLFAPEPMPNPLAGDPLRWRTEEVIQRIGQCRVVVTGSYHGGVFALAQGIPTVCLAKSRYYADKFLGLAHQFGAGCRVVLFEEGNLAARLQANVAAAWREADAVRPQLLAAAERQMALANAAYDRAFGAISSVRVAA